MSNFEFIDLAMPGDTACNYAKECPPNYNGGIVWNDPLIAIDWPLSKLLLSDKDSRHPLLNNADYDFVMHEA